MRARKSAIPFTRFRPQTGTSSLLARSTAKTSRYCCEHEGMPRGIARRHDRRRRAPARAAGPTGSRRRLSSQARASMPSKNRPAMKSARPAAICHASTAGRRRPRRARPPGGRARLQQEGADRCVGAELGGEEGVRVDEIRHPSRQCGHAPADALAGTHALAPLVDEVGRHLVPGGAGLGLGRDRRGDPDRRQVVESVEGDAPRLRLGREVPVDALGERDLTAEVGEASSADRVGSGDRGGRGGCRRRSQRPLPGKERMTVADARLDPAAERTTTERRPQPRREPAHAATEDGLARQAQLGQVRQSPTSHVCGYCSVRARARRWSRRENYSVGPVSSSRRGALRRDARARSRSDRSTTTAAPRVTKPTTSGAAIAVPASHGTVRHDRASPFQSSAPLATSPVYSPVPPRASAPERHRAEVGCLRPDPRVEAARDAARSRAPGASAAHDPERAHGRRHRHRRRRPDPPRRPLRKALAARRRGTGLRDRADHGERGRDRRHVGDESRRTPLGRADRGGAAAWPGSTRSRRSSCSRSPTRRRSLPFTIAPLVFGVDMDTLVRNHENRHVPPPPVRAGTPGPAARQRRDRPRQPDRTAPRRRPGRSVHDPRQDVPRRRHPRADVHRARQLRLHAVRRPPSACSSTASRCCARW